MKPLTIDDYDLVKHYLEKANYEGYNSNFVTMMMWNHEYHIEYEIHNHFLIMLHYYNDDYFWAMPFTTKEYYKEAIDYMIEYSKNNHFEFKIDCAIQSFVDDIKTIYNDQFIYERTKYNDDYIYEKNMLITLSGKKMQKRRNHYNAFLKNYPKFIYKDLDSVEDFNDVLECYSRWESHKEKSDSLTSEVYGIMKLLSIKKILDIEAGAIYIDNKMEAFIIASKLNHRTIQIHVEKANKNIRGLYPAILKEFLKRHFKDYLYVNREEDMGLENLRKSKLALHPMNMIKKYCIHPNKSEVIKCIKNEKEEIKKIWYDTFDDETMKSTDFYFENCFNEDNTYLLKNNNTIISGLQIVPFQMSINSINEEVYFILGVFTKKEYERQGFMKKLFKYVLSLEKYKHKKIYLQAYNPDIYKSFGFLPSHYHYKYIIDRPFDNFDKDILTNDYQFLLALYNEFVENFNEYRIRDKGYFELLIQRCKAFDEEIKVFYFNKQIDGYAIFQNNDEFISVSEIIYKSEKALKRMINTLLDINKRVIIETDLKTSIVEDKEKIIVMLSNYHNIDYSNKYINEIY